MDAGIVPVKELAAAKSRLAAALGDDTRRALARALLEDALQLCADAAFLRWWVVTRDREVAGRAAEYGVDTIEDPGRGLNAALAHAARVVKEAGAGTTTIIPADVPLARASDLQDLLDTGATSDIVVVPAGRDGGTNALCLTSPDLLEPKFGRNSFHAHIAHADAAKLRCAVLALPRLALDLDTGDDVDPLLKAAREPAGHTVTLLRSQTL